MAHWNRLFVVLVVLCLGGILLWSPAVPNDDVVATEPLATQAPRVSAPTTPMEEERTPSAAPSEVLQPAIQSDMRLAARVVSLSSNDGRLRCGKISDISSGRGAQKCTSWWQRSWFADRREPHLDGEFVTTKIRASESRPLDADANVTNNLDAAEKHHQEHWAPHWSVRYPSIIWSRAASTSQQERAVLPTEVLEARAQMQLRDIEKTQRPSAVEDLEFITSVPPLYLYRRDHPEKRWEALDAAAGERQTRSACLYAGFPRNLEKMYSSCRDTKSERSCMNVHRNKLFGNMRDNVVSATMCDVYVTTWEIRGAGRYSTTKYDMNDAFPTSLLHTVYGEQLAAAHVQNFTQYQKLWTYMHKFSRVFPQTRPTKLHVNQLTKEASFEGVPELNHVIRINDYSQSYKHWVVANLALLSTVAYDVFFRLRLDLRVSSRLDMLTPMMLNAEESHGTRAVGFRLESAPYGGPRRVNASVLESPIRYVTANRVHVGNFDIADFGFMAPPFLIEELSRLWYYCLTSPGSPIASFDFALSLTPSEKYSEYNLMLWRIIFDNKWSVDSGGRYLWVSRYGTKRRSK